MNETGGNIPCSECGNSDVVKNELPALQAGSVLNKKYLIGRCLGKGGFGITYLAYDMSFKSRMAIKEYLPRNIATRIHDDTTVQHTKEDAKSYKTGLKQFLEEAQMLRKINHQSIIPVYNCFKGNNTAYYDMPFIHGKTLEEYVIKQRGISEYELLKIMIPVLEGLRKIHKANHLYKHIKPLKICISSDENKFFLLGSGFGSVLWKIINNPCDDLFIDDNDYVPFEQYASEAVDGYYTDIYACAATMYSCLRCHISKKNHLIPPPSVFYRYYGGREILPHIKDACSQRISDRLADAIMEGLELKPENRPQTVAEFQKKIGIDPYNKIELFILAGEFEGERIPLSSKPVVIGRSPKKCNLVLSDNRIADVHCQIHVVNGIGFIKDLNSKGGIWINDVRRLKSSEIVRVEAGDTISLAGCEVFQIIDVK